MAGVCSPRYSRGWGRRIAWTQEAEVAVSWDCAIAFQPGWQEQNSVSKKKKEKRKKNCVAQMANNCNLGVDEDDIEELLEVVSGKLIHEEWFEQEQEYRA